MQYFRGIIYGAHPGACNKVDVFSMVQPNNFYPPRYTWLIIALSAACPMGGTTFVYIIHHAATHGMTHVAQLYSK